MPCYRIYFGREAYVDVEADSVDDAVQKFDKAYSDDDLEKMLQEVGIEVTDVMRDSDTY